jgi:glycine dehydrogenase subunit 2
MKTIFEKSQKEQKAYNLPRDTHFFTSFQPEDALKRRSALPLPEVSELDLLRHFSQLAQNTLSIDTAFYPLGSCTMKYNPRCNEKAARMEGFTKSHPLAEEETVQGNLELMYDLIHKLCHITGMEGGTLQPNAGAQGEFVGVKMLMAYHKKRKDHKRAHMLIPDSAHGTNPSTAHMAGLTVITIKSDADGDIDLDDLKKHLSDETAGLMLTNPNTLGLFSSKICEITELVHKAGGLLYYDGANLNPLLEIARPGDMGFDVMHINLHKTFSTPHGGGGPGSGPVFCKKNLLPFLPTPFVSLNEKGYFFTKTASDSIGRIASFHGNFGIYLRAYLYILLHGNFGLRKVAEMAVLNANYLKAKIAPLLTIPYPQPCMHEFVVQADRFLKEGVRAVDIAKRLLDYKIHPPTIYFPQIVKECLLIEPTETESKQTLDDFIDALRNILKEIEEDKEFIKNAPYTLSHRRLNEVFAAKNPNYCCSFH